MQSAISETDISRLSGIIHKVVEEYAGKGIDLWSIGNGHCENFAYRVLDLWVGEDWMHREGDGFSTVWTDQLCKDEDQLDLDLIQSFWGGLPESVTHEDLQRIGAPAHVWIQVGNLSFDAERPEGVASFLDLPFFVRHLRSDAEIEMSGMTT